MTRLPPNSTLFPYTTLSRSSEISQLVREKTRAWHIAALYDCTLNRRHECWRNGVQSNHFTVGIEHAGFVSQDSFPRAQLDRDRKSTRLNSSHGYISYAVFCL